MLIISLFISFFSVCCLQKQTPIQKLEKDLLEMISAAPGTYAIAFKDLSDSANRVLIHEKIPFHAASTMKTPVLFELYKQQAEGKLDLKDSITVINAFRSIVDSSVYQMDIGEDSEDELYRKIGDSVSLYELAHAMITKSSNLATNILIELVGAKNVTISMHEIGADNIQVLRGVEDIKAYEAGLSNRTTALDLMILFENLGKLELVDSIASIAMTEILLAQEFNDLIPALLPENVKTAHKTGSITKVLHDSGLIILPDGRKYILVVLSKDWKEEDNARQLIQQISKMIYDHMLIYK
jgi:beta-lactamase class A